MKEKLLTWLKSWDTTDKIVLGVTIALICGTVTYALVTTGTITLDDLRRGLQLILEVMHGE